MTLRLTHADGELELVEDATIVRTYRPRRATSFPNAGEPGIRLARRSSSASPSNAKEQL
jgi:hypothetical protein